nr:mucin-19 isoform X1 [Danio rerio]|eukprot:XP_021334993.1 mucin-19 isoform X1 [Danio rerio]
MEQGWKRLPLLVVFLLLWKNADGFAYSTSPNAGQWWGQSSDNTFLPLVVQSSESKAPVTGVLLEEVVSSLPKNRPKITLLQAVKGGVSSSSDSTPQDLTPNTPSSASLPVDQSGMGGLVSLQGSSGSTTAYATRGSGQLVFAQEESDGFFSKTVVSGQSTNDQSSPSLSSSASRGTTYDVITQAQGTGQFAPGSSYATISLPKYATSQLITGPSSKQFTSVYGTQTGSSAPFTLQGSTTHGGPIQTQDASIQLVSETSTPHMAVSLYKGVASQSAVPSSKQITSAYSTPTGSSALFTLQGLLQGQDSSRVALGSSAPHVEVSFPQIVTSPLTSLPSSKQITSVYSTQTGSSAPFTLQKVVQAPDATSQVVSGSSSPNVVLSLPQGVTSQSTTVQGSKKPITSVYGTPTGSSALFTLQGPLRHQDSSNRVSVSSPYVAVSLPQAVTSQSGGPISKQITSVYSTQTGSSAPFTLQRLVQAQDSTNQVVSGSSPYVTVSSPQGVTSQSTTLPSSKKLIASIYGTPTGSSALFTLQGPLQRQDSSQVVSVSSPYVTVSLPQAVTSQSGGPISKQITSVYSTQTGSSAPFTLQRLVQAQDSASQDISGSSTPYVAVSLPQDVNSPLTPLPSSKQITTVYSTEAETSAPFTLKESTTYGGLLQAQDSTSQVSVSSTPYVAVSLPQGVAIQSAVPISKQITSVYSTQTGSSAPFTLQRLVQAQDSASQDISGSSTPYVAVSLPQDVNSPLTPLPSSKQITTVYSTEAETSAPFTLKESTTYGGLLQAQDSTSQVSVSSTPYVAVSLPQGVAIQSAVPISKQITSVYSTQSGSSAPFTLQRLVQAQDSTNQVVSGSSPYVTVSSPQGVTSQSTTVPSSKKLIASIYGTPTGSSALFTLQGPLQRQDSSSQVVSVSSPYVAVSLPQDVNSPLTPLPSSKQITIVYSTEAETSAPFTLKESTTYGGLLQAQDSTSQVSVSSTPYVAVSLPQGVAIQSAVPSSKQITSVFGTQTGSSAPFTLQGSTTYGGPLQVQDAASKVVSGSSPNVAVSFPQDVTSQSVVPSSKQITSVYGTQTASFAPFRWQRLLQTEDSTGQFSPGSPSSVKTSTSYFSKPSSSSTIGRYNSVKG